MTEFSAIMTVMSSYECQPLVFAARSSHEDDQATVASDETASCYEVHMKLPSLDTPKYIDAIPPKAVFALTSETLKSASASPTVGRVTLIDIPEYWTGPGR
jgi:hypothetical protein